MPHKYQPPSRPDPTRPDPTQPNPTRPDRTPPIASQTLRDKFVWAMPVPPDWEFEALQMGKKKK